MQQSCRFTEKFLQIVWNEQLLNEGHLVCTDGFRLQVISCGVWNVGQGPDFKNAAVVIGGILYHGDIEVHRFSSDWLKHGHQRDQQYKNVVLHVVWQDDFPELSVSESLKTLELQEKLHESCRNVLAQVQEAAYPYARQVPPGGCSVRWALTDDNQVTKILDEAGWARAVRKGEKIMEAFRARDPDQVVYELIFDSLGYMNCRAEFRWLAAGCSLKELIKLESDLHREAFLFGFAGLLPDPTIDPVLPELREKVNDYWRIWWQFGRKTSGIVWPVNTGRPYNSVVRRLQTGIDFLKWANYHPAHWIDGILAEEAGNPGSLARRFNEFRNFSFRNETWEHVRDFCHAVHPAASLLGGCRKLDMLLNIFLPCAIGRARQVYGDGTPVCRALKEYWSRLPLAQENRLQKEAVHRFLMPPSRFRDVIRHASQQQGILEIYKTFCLSLSHDCSQCPFELK